VKSTGSTIFIVVAALLGLFFGNAAFGGLFGDWTGSDVLGGILGALLLGAIAAGGAWISVNRDEHTAEATTATATQVQDPPFARFLFQDARAGALWLPLRIFVGYEWLEAGWHKFNDPKWMDTGAALQGYWKNAVAVSPDTGRGPIAFEWWRGFIQTLLDNQAYTWFGKVITFGELAVGLGLIFGALVGVAAVGGLLMNMSFLLSGSTSSNPILLGAAFLLILAWKVAGWIGLDRYLLPMLGTPWQRGRLLARPTPTSGATPPAPITP
jgi:thiosulfate dehydrogenase [quinone] large subunit